MHLVDLTALILAVGGLVDCWLNGGVFAKYRARLAGWTLFSCDYCLNWQAPIWLILLFYLPGLWLPSPWDVAVRLPIYALAAAYAAWLINEARAGRECDYSRSRRGADDREKYGGMPDDARPDWPTHVQLYKLPALFYSDGQFHHFCTADCRTAFVMGARGDAETCTEGWTGLYADDGHCDHCARPLKPSTPPRSFPALTFKDTRTHYFCSVDCQDKYRIDATAAGDPPVAVMGRDVADDPDERCAQCKKSLKQEAYA